MAVLADMGISKSEVSRIRAGLDETVEAFKNRRLGHVKFSYVYLDATYLNVRNDLGHSASMAVVAAVGVTGHGKREVLGCDIADSETEAFWRQLFQRRQIGHPDHSAGHASH